MGWKGHHGASVAFPCGESGQAGALDDTRAAGEMAGETEQREPGTVSAQGQCQQHTQLTGTAPSDCRYKGSGTHYYSVSFILYLLTF